MVEVQQTTKQHPIPQQVLGVQFKLVGDLTLKQFGYLAGGGLLAFLVLTSHLFFLLRFTLAGLFFFGGVGLALVPIQDQPMDQWLASFFRAVFSPTRWVWQKTAEPPEFLTMPTPKLAEVVEERASPEEARRKLQQYIAALNEEEALEPVDLAEKTYLEAINAEIREMAPIPTPPPTQPPAPAAPETAAPPTPAPAKPTKETLPPPSPPKRRSEDMSKEFTLASTINYAAEPVFKLQRGASITYVTTLKNVRVGRKFRPIPTGETVFAPARERVIAAEEPPPPPALPKIEPLPPSPPAVPIEKPPSAPPPTTSIPVPAVTERPPEIPSKPSEEIKPPPAPPKPAEKAPPPPLTLPAPERPQPPLPAKGPNVISGSVRDKEGRPIGGASVVVKDSAGVTRRATVTDQLGQFCFSPFPNGRYTIALPKSKLPFAIMSVELTGEEVPPLEMKPKGQGVSD